ncbi:MAG TPA: hypothetical protein VLA49_02600 [Anaerolineales bacterium]|nr:hypothetical protein [Anaerolineales bacterium]
MKPEYLPYIKRLIITLIIALFIVVVINEGFYLFQKEKTDRAPRTVQIVIPNGTAAQVAAGEPVPAIPEAMVFVVGDVLEVKNEDIAQHQLGPIWVPAGATGSLVLETADKYSYSCSFVPSRYLGVDVRQATTLATRLTALGIATPPMAVFLFIYGLLVFPIKRPEKEKSQAERPGGENG